MKILYCIFQMGTGGGVERVLTIKANYLKTKGYDVRILTCLPLKGSPKYDLDPSIQIDYLGEGLDYAEDFQLSSLGARFFSTIRKMRKHYRLMKAYLKENRFDVVVTTHAYEMGFLPFIKDGSKKILELHSSKMMYKMQRFDRQDWRTGLLVRLFEWRDAFVNHFFDAVGCLTEEDRQSRGCPSNMYVIPNPLPFVAEKTSSCANPIVLAVGRLAEEKNFSALIDVWATLADDFPEWRLQIVGGGYLATSLSKQIERCDLVGRVLLVGEASDPRAYYEQASVLVMTSRYEGLPMTLLEAQAYGLPIVSYACPCGPRDIVLDGTGFVVPVDDKVSFAQKLRLLMQNESMRESMGVKALESSKRYRVQGVMGKWENLFKGQR